MKKTTIINILIGLFLVSLVTGGIISVITSADFIAPPMERPIRYEGNITFEVDGKPVTCYLSEWNMEIDDDFEDDCLKDYEGKRITNVKDWTGREYKEVTVGGLTHRSFDEDKLKSLS